MSEHILKAYKLLYSGDWHRIFDLVEFVHDTMVNASDIEFSRSAGDFSKDINDALQRENVGYRLADGKFIPITNDEEVDAIKQATTSPHKNAREHIKKACALLADRQQPDYENSIKESICAVESLAYEITGESNFSNAIGKLKDRGIDMHPQFAKAAINLYQFSSDEEGIRHGATGESLRCDQPTAYYMLVVCSAFVNYVGAKLASE